MKAKYKELQENDYMLNNKKQILIVFTDELDIGGIEISLLNLLTSIDYSAYSVDLFLYSNSGAYFDKIPKEVNILPEVKELTHLRDSLKSKIMSGCWRAAYHRLRWQLFGKGITLEEEYSKIIESCVPKFEKEYDLAIGFFRPFDIIKTKVNAKVKVGWIHTDYTEEDNKGIVKDYIGLDYIAAVSKDVKFSFMQATKGCFNDKSILVIENIYNTEEIKSKAEAFSVTSEMPNKGVKILSIGRFSYPKWFDRVPAICKRLRSSGVDAYWYLIGFGKDEYRIRSAIETTDMSQYVKVLGKKENPYPYIKACNYYIQPSRYEGKSVAVRESQILCKPVIITNYPTAQSQISDGIDGFIVPMDLEGCVDGIKRVIQSDKTDSVVQYLQSTDLSNKSEIDKLLSLI